ncbi:hypothetical protein BD410DRAFT_539042 [Rickenella mellea]|uniref:Uncharacterized protein n=1 Tax=Rickenella mellea TaxID=50990 RepID=A0A4Y7PT35_9AGAM|nr:hypothetical protein BD410DRAFT_539042 [Rickenella mellea]
MSDLRQYISDNALRIFGLSDKAIVDYVVASALFSSLNAYGLPDNSDSHAFVTNVYSKVPRKSKHKHSSDSARKQAERDAKALRSQQFSLLLDDESGQADAFSPPKKDKGKEKEKEKDRSSRKERHTRKRESDGRDWESDEEEQVRKRRRSDAYSPERRREGDEADGGDLPDEDEDVRRERERMQDLKERDAFAERVKNRDRDKTKKVIEDRSSKGAAAEAAQRRTLADDAAARVAAMPSLRERSRQDYLTKRELQQIELLRKEIADEEALFRGSKISKKERRDLEYKKEVLKLAEDRMKIDDRRRKSLSCTNDTRRRRSRRTSSSRTWTNGRRVKRSTVPSRLVLLTRKRLSMITNTYSTRVKP